MTTEQKHTPGPWKQNADTVWRGKQPIVCHPVNDPRSIADARLIASAPDLLAALMEIEKVAMRNDGSPYDTKSGEIAEITRTAIAKATQPQP